MSEYTVVQGDCLSSIAKRFGLASWRTIYNHPSNAEFKRKRPDPNLIYPGDKLFIPELEEKQVNAPVDASTRFRKKSEPVLLRVFLKDDEERALGNRRYRLEVRGLATPFEGRTAGDGKVEHTIPATSTFGKLLVFLTDDANDPGLGIPLEIGSLDPIDTTEGLQARLNNLGYDAGPVDGVAKPRTTDATKSFQKKNGLTESGENNESTQSKLRQKYGC